MGPVDEVSTLDRTQARAFECVLLHNYTCMSGGGMRLSCHFQGNIHAKHGFILWHRMHWLCGLTSLSAKAMSTWYTGGGGAGAAEDLMRSGTPEYSCRPVHAAAGGIEGHAGHRAREQARSSTLSWSTG